MAEIELIFDHVGIPVDSVQPNEEWVESTRVWLTNPHEHRYRVEYLRFEADTPCRWEIVNLPHVAYRVKFEDFSILIEDAQILMEPFDVDDNLSIAFVLKHGIPVEYLAYKDHDLWRGKEMSSE